MVPNMTYLLLKQHSSFNSVEQRRNQAKSIIFYKIINNIVSINFHQYLQPSVAITRGNHLRFIQLQARVDVYLHSFLPSTIRLWNSLPANVISSLTIDNFKNKLTSIHAHYTLHRGLCIIRVSHGH